MSYAFAIPKRRNIFQELGGQLNCYVSGLTNKYQSKVANAQEAKREASSVKDSYRQLDPIATKTQALLNELGNNNHAQTLQSNYNSLLQRDVQNYIVSRNLNFTKAQETIRTSGKNAKGEYTRLITYVNEQRKGYLISLMAGLDSLGGQGADDSLANSLGGSAPANPKGSQSDPSQDPKKDNEGKKQKKRPTLKSYFDAIRGKSQDSVEDTSEGDTSQPAQPGYTKKLLPRPYSEALAEKNAGTPGEDVGDLESIPIALPSPPEKTEEYTFQDFLQENRDLLDAVATNDQARITLIRNNVARELFRVDYFLQRAEMGAEININENLKNANDALRRLEELTGDRAYLDRALEISRSIGDQFGIEKTEEALAKYQTDQTPVEDSGIVGEDVSRYTNFVNSQMEAINDPTRLAFTLYRLSELGEGDFVETSYNMLESTQGTSDEFKRFLHVAGSYEQNPPTTEEPTTSERRETDDIKKYLESQINNLTEPEIVADALEKLSKEGGEEHIKIINEKMTERYKGREEFKILQREQAKRYLNAQIDNLTEPETVADALYNLSEVGEKDLTGIFIALSEKYKGTEEGERFKRRIKSYDSKESSPRTTILEREPSEVDILLEELETPGPRVVRLCDISFWNKSPRNWSREEYEDAVHTLYDIEGKKPRVQNDETSYIQVDLTGAIKVSKQPRYKLLFSKTREQAESHTKESAMEEIEGKIQDYWGARKRKIGLVKKMSIVEKDGKKAKESVYYLPWYGQLFPKKGEKIKIKEQELVAEDDPHPIDYRVNPLGQAFANFHNNAAFNNIRNAQLSYKPLMYTTAAVLGIAGLAYYYRHNLGELINGMASLFSGSADTPPPNPPPPPIPSSSPGIGGSVPPSPTPSPTHSATPAVTPSHIPSPTHTASPHVTPSHTPSPHVTHTPTHPTTHTPIPHHTSTHSPPRGISSSVFREGLSDYFEWGYLKDQGHLKRVHSWAELNGHIKSLIDNNPSLTQGQQNRLVEACKKGYMVYDHYVPTQSALQADPYLYGSATKTMSLDRIMDIGQSIGSQMITNAKIGVTMTAQDVSNYYSSFTQGLRSIFAA